MLHRCWAGRPRARTYKSRISHMRRASRTACDVLLVAGRWDPSAFPLCAPTDFAYSHCGSCGPSQMFCRGMLARQQQLLMMLRSSLVRVPSVIRAEARILFHFFPLFRSVPASVVSPCLASFRRRGGRAQEQPLPLKSSTQSLSSAQADPPSRPCAFNAPQQAFPAW